MSIYKIKFINNGPSSFGSDFTLYGAPPIVGQFNVAIPTWSNSFSTKTVPKGGQWNLTVNGAPWAFCGTSSQSPLVAGTNVDTSMVRQATIGFHGSGSTHHLYNAQGFPAFQDHESYDAPAGAFQIDTTNDFTPNLKWVAGYALSDGSGQTRPVATFGVGVVSKYTVLLPLAPKFYLCAFQSTLGALIDPGLSKLSAEIDFAQHPGQFNAIVTLEASGSYHVEFYTQSMFAMKAANPVSVSQNSSAHLSQLKHQVKIMSDLINTALGISEPTTLGTNTWACSFKWNQSSPIIIPDAVKNQVAYLLGDAMKNRGYVLKRKNINPDLVLTFTHPTKNLKALVLGDWIVSWNDLPPWAKPLLTSPNVERVYFTQDDASSPGALEVPEVTLPVIRPQYECSLDWLEGPSEEIKQTIADILESSMKRQDYYTFQSRIGDKSLVLPVWHVDRPSAETVRGHWQMAVQRLHKVFLGNYVANLQVEPILYTLSDDATTAGQTVNGQDSATVFPPRDQSYACYLTWLEGPPLHARMAIARKLRHVMVGKGYQLTGQNLAGDKLAMSFSHSPSWTLEQATKDWFEAYNSLGYEKMYVTDPVVEPMFGPAANAGATGTIFPPLDPSYICSLAWRNNPTEQVKRSIASQLVWWVGTQHYRLEGLDIGGDELRLLVSHEQPSDLETATKDWNIAWQRLGPQLIHYTTDPRCEDAFVIDVNDDASKSVLPVMPPTYVCSGKWLEGADTRTQNDILRYLILFMTKREYYLLSLDNSNEKFSIYFSHDFPADLPAAKADYNVALDSLGLQRNYVGNAQCEFAITVQSGNVSLSDLKLDDTAALPISTNDTNGTNGAGVSASTQGLETVGPAPEVQTSAMVASESLEAKKRRALELLRAEGLVGFGDVMSVA